MRFRIDTTRYSINLSITLRTTSKYAAVDRLPVGFRYEMSCILMGCYSTLLPPEPLLVFRFSVYIIDYHPIRWLCARGFGNKTDPYAKHSLLSPKHGTLKLSVKDLCASPIPSSHACTQNGESTENRNRIRVTMRAHFDRRKSTQFQVTVVAFEAFMCEAFDDRK